MYMVYNINCSKGTELESEVIMVKYVDNGVVCGWYFVKENCYFGDGTKMTAERIERMENR